MSSPEAVKIEKKNKARSLFNQLILKCTTNLVKAKSD